MTTSAEEDDDEDDDDLPDNDKTMSVGPVVYAGGTRFYHSIRKGLIMMNRSTELINSDDRAAICCQVRSRSSKFIGRDGFSKW